MNDSAARELLRCHLLQLFHLFLGFGDITRWRGEADESLNVLDRRVNFASVSENHTIQLLQLWDLVVMIQAKSMGRAGLGVCYVAEVKVCG